MIIADTSGLGTIFNCRQPEHQAARAAVERDGGQLVLPALVLAELVYFVLARRCCRSGRTTICPSTD